MCVGKCHIIVSIVNFESLMMGFVDPPPYLLSLNFHNFCNSVKTSVNILDVSSFFLLSFSC